MSIDTSLNSNTTTKIKGLAILLVVFSHLIQKHFINLGQYNSRFLCAGAWGVSLFLMVSGYGLTMSYQKHGPKKFFQKRLVSVMMPYCLVQALSFILSFLVLQKKYPSKIIILSMLGVNLDIYNGPDPSMWFIPFILLWYVVFYLTFKLVKKDAIRAIFMLIMSYFMIYVFKMFSGYFFKLLIFNAFFFPMGVWFAMISTYIPHIKLRTILAFFNISIILFLLIWIYKPLDNQTLTELLVPMIYLGAMLLQRWNWKYNVFRFIGSISFEIYLVEWLFLAQFNVLKITQNKFGGILLYAAVTFFTAFILSKFVGQVKSKFDNIINKKISISY